VQNHTTRLALLTFAILTVAAAGISAANPLPLNLERVDDKAPCFRWPAVDYDEDGVYDRIDYCPNTPKGCAVDQWGCSSDADNDGVCDELDHCAGTPKGEKVDVHGCSQGQAAGHTPPPAPPVTKAEPVTPPPPAPKPAPPAPKTEVERKLVESGTVRLENILFETNSARLLPESEQSLNEAGDALSKYPDLRIEIGGHSDTRGAAAGNRRLSQSRAESVRTYLLDHFTALRAANLTAKGYGESQPITQERNAAELQENRRVELKVLNPEALPGNVKIVN
jgi:OOP family OmpA-OmpF porin